MRWIKFFGNIINFFDSGTRSVCFIFPFLGSSLRINKILYTSVTGSGFTIPRSTAPTPCSRDASTSCRQKASRLKKRTRIFRLQAEDDKRRLSENAFTIRKLKSERKWYFATGFGLGFCTGAFTGYRLGARFSF